MDRQIVRHPASGRAHRARATIAGPWPSGRRARWGCTLAVPLALTACLAAPATLPPARPELAAASALPPSVAPEVAPTSAPPAGSGELWIPAIGLVWQWQLSEGTIDLDVEAQVYDVDLFDTPRETVAALHARGRKVICYLSAGSWEDWRPDAGAFPPEVIGRAYAGWPGERWLDIRQIDRLAPILTARLELCRDKGFDAVEPDNLDGYDTDTGFAITFEDQLAFNRWLASQAHALGLSIGLKNDPEQAADLVADFDWALTEDCFDQGWCSSMLPFLEAGKPVFAAEYTDTGVDFEAACEALGPAGFSLILKDRELSAWRQTCPP